jgi:integrase/recombinase XerC
MTDRDRKLQPTRGAEATSNGIPGGIADELLTVLGSWAGDPGFAELTLVRMGEVARRFARYVHASGCDSLRNTGTGVCQDFIGAPTRAGSPPTTNTRHFRRTTIRTLLRTLRQLGVDAYDPTIDIVLPPRSGSGVRALTDDEITLARATTFAAALSDLRRPAAWALAEASATTSEIAQLTTVDVIDDGERVTASLPGARSATPRVVDATDWGSRILRRRLLEVGPGARLVYGGDKHPGAGSAQAAVCNLIGAVLFAAGLSPDPGVRPSSVRLWRAGAELDNTGSIEAAARLLGARSLDTVAAQLARRWQS